MPEWIVYGLGGELVREPSLASRTGLIDQGTGEVWADALAAAGLPARILPDERPGFRAGYLAHEGVVSGAAGAVLTVAGHDHPVAAIGVGAVETDELFNSSGTADVLARSVPGTLDETQRQRVVAAGGSWAGTCCQTRACYWPASVAGCCSVACWPRWAPSPCRRGPRLITPAWPSATCPTACLVAGDGRTQDDVVIRLQDGVTPASVWTAAVRYTAAQARLLLNDIEPVVGPHRRAVAAGGWTQMASVRAAKAAAIEAMSFSRVVQPGVTGAALVAAFALDGQGLTLAEFIRLSADDPDPLKTVSVKE